MSAPTGFTNTASRAAWTESLKALSVKSWIEKAKASVGSEIAVLARRPNRSGLVVARQIAILREVQQELSDYADDPATKSAAVKKQLLPLSHVLGVNNEWHLDPARHLLVVPSLNTDGLIGASEENKELDVALQQANSLSTVRKGSNRFVFLDAMEARLQCRLNIPLVEEQIAQPPNAEVASARQRRIQNERAWRRGAVAMGCNVKPLSGPEAALAYWATLGGRATFTETVMMDAALMGLSSARSLLGLSAGSLGSAGGFSAIS